MDTLARHRRRALHRRRDAADRILYVGKAKDLRQRLNHYRVANPDRMPRRHLRLVRDVSIAEELSQEVFLRVYRTRDYQPTAKLRSWRSGI